MVEFVLYERGFGGRDFSILKGNYFSGFSNEKTVPAIHRHGLLLSATIDN